MHRTKYAQGAVRSSGDDYDRLSGLQKTAVIFMLIFVCSAIGWALETLAFKIYDGKYYERGFLTLPFCPLYGFSLGGIYLITGTPFRGKWTRLGAFALVPYALLAALLATAVEFTTGLFFDKAYGLRLWDYTGYSYSLGCYVNLWYSLLWGALATLGMGFVWQPLMNVFARVDQKVLLCAVIVFAVALASDFVFNLIYLAANGTHFEPFPHIFI